MAEHCVLAASTALNRGLRWSTVRAALLHDAHEAVVHDLPPGLKAMLPDYLALADRIQAAILAALGVPAATDEEAEAVWQIDLALRVKEVRDGYAPPCDLGLPADLSLYGVPACVGQAPETAARQFIEQYTYLDRHLRGDPAGLGSPPPVRAPRSPEGLS